LNTWIDFNIDGDWSDPNEQIFTDEPLNTGLNLLSFNVPADANIGNSYARFRFSTSSGAGISGVMPDGEVEDYKVLIKACPCGGDVANTGASPDPDGQVDIGDLSPILILMLTQYPNGDPTGLYNVGLPAYLSCADIAQTNSQPGSDGQVDIGDLNAIVLEMLLTYPNGDPTGQYLLPECF
jgi:hypothetical protein